MRLSWQVTVVALAVAPLACSLPSEGLMPYEDAGPRAGLDGTVDAGVAADDGAREASADDATTIAEASGDGMTLHGPDAGETGVPDARTSDTSLEAALACAGPTASPCTRPGGAGAGICSNGGACAACVDTRDDSSCTMAYGSSSKAYICLSGVCVPGDCHTNGDCMHSPSGPLCGVAAPHLCGPCQTSAQCAIATPDAPNCDVGTGQCVVVTCAATVQNPPPACPVNPAETCCAGHCQMGGNGVCCPGPGANAYCANLLTAPRATCTGGVCTICPPAAGGAYLVDPVNGDDLMGTGAATAQGCALRTIAAALQLIGAPTRPTTITVAGPSTVGKGEVFPIPLPSNVTLTTSGGTVTVAVPAIREGFTLAAANSGITGSASAPLVISGQSSMASAGIVVTDGCQLSTLIAGVTISNFLGSGIEVSGSGQVTIGPGVTSTQNGASGLHVTNNGHAEVLVGPGATPTHFDANSGSGILVDMDGWVTVSGTVTNAMAGEGTITTNQNVVAGLSVTETALRPNNVVTGLVSFGTKAGPGMTFVGGVIVKVRESASLGNSGPGVQVSDSPSSKDITEINLGKTNPMDFGHNVFQASGAAQNGAAGICLDSSTKRGVLPAEGNIFGTANCATTVTALEINIGACDNAGCASSICALGITNNGDISVSTCTHP